MSALSLVYRVAMFVAMAVVFATTFIPQPCRMGPVVPIEPIVGADE